MNNAVIIGRTTREPELRYTQGGTAMGTFTVAIDRPISKQKKAELESQGKQTADFINVVCWRQTAEFVSNNLGKGKLVAVQGNLRSGSYEKDGVTIYTTDINAFNVEILEWENDYNQSQETDDSPGEDFHPIDNDDIPF